MTAQIKIRKRLRTDWFRVLSDLAYAGVNQAAVSEMINIPRSTIRGWAAGSEPSHDDGYALLEIWIRVTGRPFEDRPMVEKGGIPLART